MVKRDKISSHTTQHFGRHNQSDFERLDRKPIASVRSFRHYCEALLTKQSSSGWFPQVSWNKSSTRGIDTEGRILTRGGDGSTSRPLKSPWYHRMKLSVALL